MASRFHGWGAIGPLPATGERRSWLRTGPLGFGIPSRLRIQPLDTIDRPSFVELLGALR